MTDIGAAESEIVRSQNVQLLAESEGTHATANITVTSSNYITFTALQIGTAGNSVSVKINTGSGIDESVSVSSNAITVTMRKNGSTLQHIINAIGSYAQASALVTSSITGNSSSRLSRSVTSTRLTVGSNTKTTQTYNMMRGIRFEKNHPETRTDHGLTRTYGHASPDIVLRFLLSASHNAFEDLKIKSTRNGTGVLPNNEWTIRAISDDNTPKIIKLIGKLFDFNWEKSDDTAQEPIDMECKIRITNDNVTIT